MTWPQVEYLATRARQHQDVYFNMWRLRWFAHALATAPSRLFDGNIFHPERRTLTYSDAMIVEGVVAAPLLWAGVPPMLVHNLLLLGAIVASAVGMFVLVRSLTGSSARRRARGTRLRVRAVPLRALHAHGAAVDHVDAVVVLGVAPDASRRRRGVDGLLTGLFVALQMLSSIYYGVFLARCSA